VAVVLCGELFACQSCECGQIPSKRGTVDRRDSPFQFGSELGILVIFYLFAVVFPIGLAFQERDRAKAREEINKPLQT